MLSRIPGTRYMGSKYKILNAIWQAVWDLEFQTVLDAFSGTSSVAYLFKAHGKSVHANDIMHFCYHYANAFIANNHIKLGKDDIAMLLNMDGPAATFIRDNFAGLYFEDEENKFLDHVRANVNLLDDPVKQSLALSALVRACLKKRPRGIFSYTGFRYNDGRRDIQISLRQHFLESVEVFNRAVFDNGGTHRASNRNIFELETTPDLVYIDPPYYSPRSDSDYVRRYHFVEGLVRYWQGVEMQPHTKTKKFKKYPTDFDGRDATYQAFPRLFQKFKDSILVVSYSSNSLPDRDEIIQMLENLGKKVQVIAVNHKYSFGTQHAGKKIANDVREYIFVAT